MQDLPRKKTIVRGAMQRRDFLKYSGAGAVALGLGRAAVAVESALASQCQGGATYNLT